MWSDWSCTDRRFEPLLPEPTPSKPPPEELSPIRKRIVEQILPQVIPSYHPHARFNKITHGVALNLELQAPTYTTCVELPGYLGHAVGEPGFAGLTNVRDLGSQPEKDAWIDYLKADDKTVRPKPGDIYTICDSTGLIIHIGVVSEINGDIWVTADAGQGEKLKQRADYITHRFSEKDGTLTAISRQHAGGTARERYPKARRVCGWLNIEKYLGLEPKPDSPAHNGPGDVPDSVYIAP